MFSSLEEYSWLVGFMILRHPVKKIKWSNKIPELKAIFEMEGQGDLD